MAIPAFVNNAAYHFSSVDVYADGAIDAWGFLDRSLFQKRIAKGWIATAPPPGSRISIFNLGWATVADGNWSLAVDDIVSQVDDTIRRLNPRGTDLFDLQGSDRELRVKGRPHALVMSDKKPCIPGNPLLVGEHVPIFRCSEDSFVLETWFVFEDGSSRIGTMEDREDLEATMARLSSRELTTSVPDGALIRLGNLGSFRVGAGHWFVKPDERRREVLDLLGQARGLDSSIALCVAAFTGFKGESTEANRERLRTAYEAVPEHLRGYCGDMDSRDWPIRAALYGDDDEKRGPVPK